MKYSDEEIIKLNKAGICSIDDEIKRFILVCIMLIKYGDEDFVEEEYDIEAPGKICMRIKKLAGQDFGLITSAYEGVERRFKFNEMGYEEIEELVKA